MRDSKLRFGLHKYMRKFMDDPDFDNVTRVHDWRNYVPMNVRRAWPEFSDLAREAIIHITDEIAQAEDWD